MGIPLIISVDDHIVETTDLWQARLPASMRDRAPRVDRVRGRYAPGNAIDCYGLDRFGIQG